MDLLNRGSFQDSTYTANIQLKQFCFSQRKSKVVTFSIKPTRTCTYFEYCLRNMLKNIFSRVLNLNFSKF